MKESKSIEYLEKAVNSSQIFKEAFNLFRPSLTKEKKKIFLSLFLVLLSKFIAISSITIFKTAIDFMTQMQSKADLFQSIGFYFFSWVISGFLLEIKDSIFSTMVGKTTNSLYNSTFQHIHNLCSSDRRRKKSYEIVHCLQSGTRSIERFLSFSILYLIPLSFEFVAIISIVFLFYNFKYGLVILCTFSAYAFFVLKTGEKKLSLAKKLSASDNFLCSKMNDSIKNFELIKVFGRIEYECDKLRDNFETHQQISIANNKLTHHCNIVQHSIISLGFLILTIFAILDVINHQISIGDFVLLNSYMIRCNLPLKHLGLAHKEIKNSLSGITEILSILNDKTEQKQVAPKTLKNFDISFNNVNFEYTKDQRTLRDISFLIKENSKTAIVGESGSGKSTLIKLILNLYKQNKGQITIGGTDIKCIDCNMYSETIAFIPQESFLFDDTLKYNILYANISADEDELNEIIKLSKLESLLEKMPDKYETLIGENGIRLSRGEKQRVSLARAMMKRKAKIFIADEPTSSLDNNLARIIERTLRKMTIDKTLIMVSHSITRIVDFDMIIVMNQGKIEAIGNHISLLKTSETYNKLYNLEAPQQQSAESTIFEDHYESLPQ